MKKLLLFIFLISAFGSEIAVGQDPNQVTLMCRVPDDSKCKKKPFALKFPNLAVCLGLAQPYDEVIGAIEWCRKSYTRVGVDECGKTIQWRATDITYRYVLYNGAYGECFTRTQIDGPIEYVEIIDTSCANACSQRQPVQCADGGKNVAVHK